MNKKTLLSALPSLILLIIALFTGKSAMDSKQLADDLAAKLSAGSEAPAAVIASGNQVEVVYRDRVVSRYLPAEGSVKLNTVEYQKALSALDSLLKMREGAIETGHTETPVANGAEVPGLIAPPAAITTSIDSLKAIVYDPIGSGLLTIKTWGLCLRPQIGGGWSGQLSPYLGLKVAFWNRAGIVLGTTSHQAGIGVSYRLDRWIKPLRNTEGMILYGIPFRKDNGGLYAGLAVNL